MLALFFLLLFLFFPFVFSGFAILLPKNKKLFLKIKLFGFIPLISKTFSMQGLKIIDEKKGKPVKIDKGGNPAKLKFFNFVKTQVVFQAKTQEEFPYFMVFVCGELFLLFQKAFADKKTVYLTAWGKYTIIAAKSIFYTCFAKIIFRTLIFFGEKLWTTLKTKLKKSSTV